MFDSDPRAAAGRRFFSVCAMRGLAAALLLAASFLSAPATQANQSEARDVRRVQFPDAALALANYYEILGYNLEAVRAEEGGASVPRVYLTALPSDLDALYSVAERKAIFIRSMLPLVLKANEEVAATRADIQRLRDRRDGGAALDGEERRWLLQVGERYGLAADSLDGLDLAALLTRVDEVPPSLALAQAILESGWGTSRFAQEGNALFGQRTWAEATPGLTPERAEGFRVRAFKDLGQSVRGYLHNLNVSGAYAELRDMRAAMRAKGEALDGHRLAATLSRYSEEGEHYIAKLRGLMEHNALNAFDSVELRETQTAQRLFPDDSVFRLQVAAAPQR